MSKIEIHQQLFDFFDNFFDRKMSLEKAGNNLLIVPANAPNSPYKIGYKVGTSGECYWLDVAALHRFLSAQLGNEVSLDKKNGVLQIVVNDNPDYPYEVGREIQETSAKKEDVDLIRSQYPDGTHVILDYMDDVQAPPVGSMGIVKSVDDVGQVHVAWENGSGLALIPGVDRFHIEEPATEVWRVYAMDCYLTESGWVENQRQLVGRIKLPACLDNPEAEAHAVLTALTKLDISDVTGFRTQKALATTDPSLVAVEDVYGDGTWLEVVSVRADMIPVYGLELVQKGDE